MEEDTDINQAAISQQVSNSREYIKNRYGAFNANQYVGGGGMIQIPAQQITKRVTKTIKTYDEEGRVVSEETTEEITYGTTPPAWQYPIVSSGT